MHSYVYLNQIHLVKLNNLKHVLGTLSSLLFIFLALILPFLAWPGIHLDYWNGFSGGIKEFKTNQVQLKHALSVIQIGIVSNLFHTSRWNLAG